MDSGAWRATVHGVKKRLSAVTLKISVTPQSISFGPEFSTNLQNHYSNACWAPFLPECHTSFSNSMRTKAEPTPSPHPPAPPAPITQHLAPLVNVSCIRPFLSILHHLQDLVIWSLITVIASLPLSLLTILLHPAVKSNLKHKSTPTLRGIHRSDLPTNWPKCCALSFFPALAVLGPGPGKLILSLLEAPFKYLLLEVVLQASRLLTLSSDRCPPLCSLVP